MNHGGAVRTPDDGERHIPGQTSRQHSLTRLIFFVRKRLPRSLAALVLSTVIALCLAEILVRTFDWDWDWTEASLYYQCLDLPLHEAVDNTELLYRLRPNARWVSGDYVVTINSLGFRGADVTPEKPAGTYRIVVVGGSNVYGAAVRDEQTWPFRLEQELNRRHETQFEVLNMGVSGYVGSQMAATAKRALKELDPDMILWAHSNVGMRPILQGSDVRGYFRKHPELWFELVIDPRLRTFPDKWELWAVEHWRFYRLALVALTAKFGRRSYLAEHHNNKNELITEKFVESLPDDIGIAVIVYPGIRMPVFVEDIDRKIGLPHYLLEYTGDDEKYLEIHPPAYVYEWYADNIATWLEGNFDLPD